MWQRALSGSGGGGGSADWQYGAGLSSTGNTITADHSADKIIIVTNLNANFDFTLTIGSGTYHKSNATISYNTGANYQGFGMCYYVVEVSISVGDIVTFKSTAGAPNDAVFALF